MRESVPPRAAWTIADEGWGRRAADFATLSEPANCREYITLHQQLNVGPSDRLLDVACGAGLAVELAQARGATCAGLDASTRLIAVARDPSPDADLRVLFGDIEPSTSSMHHFHGRLLRRNHSMSVAGRAGKSEV